MDQEFNKATDEKRARLPRCVSTEWLSTHFWPQFHAGQQVMKSGLKELINHHWSSFISYTLVAYLCKHISPLIKTKTKTNNITTDLWYYNYIMTFPNTIRLVIQTLLILSAFFTCEVHGFGARRDYHSYHHISKRSNKKMSSTSMSASQSEEIEVERILEKAAEIRRNLAELDGKVFCSYNSNKKKTDC
jgi:nitrogen regulatory protein PII